MLATCPRTRELQHVAMLQGSHGSKCSQSTNNGQRRCTWRDAIPDAESKVLRCSLSPLRSCTRHRQKLSADSAGIVKARLVFVVICCPLPGNRSASSPPRKLGGLCEGVWPSIIWMIGLAIHIVPTGPPEAGDVRGCLRFIVVLICSPFS